MGIRTAPYLDPHVIGLWRQYGGDTRLWTHGDIVRATGTYLSDITYGDYEFVNGTIYDTRSMSAIQSINPGQYVIIAQYRGGAVSVFSEIPFSELNNSRLPGSQAYINFSASVLDRNGNEYSYAPVTISATRTDAQTYIRELGNGRFEYRDIQFGGAGDATREQAVLEGFRLATPDEAAQRAVRAYVLEHDQGRLHEALREGIMREDGSLLIGDTKENFYELVSTIMKDANIGPDAGLRYTLGTYS